MIDPDQLIDPQMRGLRPGPFLERPPRTRRTNLLESTAPRTSTPILSTTLTTCPVTLEITTLLARVHRGARLRASTSLDRDPRPPSLSDASVHGEGTARTPPPPSPPFSNPRPPPSPPPPYAFADTASLRTAVAAYNADAASATATYGPISSWDVSAITNMSGLFAGLPQFNADMSSWNTSSVTDTGYMFEVRSALPLTNP